jgi:hypothetical protein
LRGDIRTPGAQPLCEICRRVWIGCIHVLVPRDVWIASRRFVRYASQGETSTLDSRRMETNSRRLETLA